MSVAAHRRTWWLGPEVEGQLRLTRPLTAIVRLPPKSVAPILGAGVQHVFLTEDFKAWGWLGELCRKWHGPITIGCWARDTERLELINRLPYRHRVRVMLRFFVEQLDALDGLQPTDEVSVGAPYDLLTFVAGHGVRTRPQDYEDDR